MPGKGKKSGPSKHDRKVAQVAGGYKARGWKVAADIPGYKRPKTVGGRRPDVIAKKGLKTRIVEVETPSSVDSKRDVEQQSTFRKWARASSRRQFRRKVTD